MKTCSVKITLLFIAILALEGKGLAAQAPDFNLPAPEGKRVSLKGLLENGPVILDFWATWCKPCIKAMPKLARLHDEYKEGGLTVLGINEDGPRGQARVKPFLRSKGIRFPVVIDGDGSVSKRMQVGALPVTFLINQEGEIVLRQTGYPPKNPDALENAVKSLLLPLEQSGENDVEE